MAIDMTIAMIKKSISNNSYAYKCYWMNKQSSRGTREPLMEKRMN